MLSFYGLPGDDLVFSQNLNWTMEVDYQYARALYDKSGIKYTAPEGKPIRFINMYSDFVVFNRAHKWARYLDDFQQDPYVGRFCRTSLVPKGAKVRAEMDDYCLSNGFYAGNNLLEQTTCRVNQVSEAVMCLKGIDVLTLMNYEWKSSYDPNNTYVQEGARLYQDTVFPDLDACLARRELLVGKLGRDDALQQLTQELAKNYSLDATGFGGKKGLFEEFLFYQGFTDLSGKPSGVRYSKMSGSLPERTQPFESDLNALVVGRERLWWLAGETPKDFRDQVVDFSYYAPYLFMGMHIDNQADSTRFVERYEIKKADTVGICQNWNFVKTANRTYPDPVYLDVEPIPSVLTGYGKLFTTRAVRDYNVTDATEVSLLRSRVSTLCVVRDGCLQPCAQPAAGTWVATFNRGGACRSRQVSQSVLNRQGFVDWRCMGEGVGNDTLMLMFTEPIATGNGSEITNSTVEGLASPAAIIACVLGGRVPQPGDEPYPNVFYDLLHDGPSTTITTTLSRGTEKVLVNMYVLVSLLGCAIFSSWVIGNVVAVLRTLQRVKTSGTCDRHIMTQLVDAFFTINFSTASHGRNIQLSRVILWLNLVTWYIGAADINCTWWVDGVDLWTPGFTLKTSDSPYYKCKPGQYVAHLGSLVGLMRIVSIAYNFKSLTCQHSILRGATRHTRSIVSPMMLFGLLPTFIVSVTITAINRFRHHLGILSIVHNQLFLITLWVAFLVAYNRLLHHETIGRLYVNLLCKLNVCGRQKVKPGSVAAALVGSYYLTLPEFVRQEETEWIPLSVAVECQNFKLENLDYAARKYSFTGQSPHTQDTPDAVSIPPWVLDDDEYFFC